MTLQKGDKAPSFSLFSSDKKEVKLEDFKDKNLIVHFFPFAFTGVCTAQLCAVRDGISMYKNDNADVVAISVDSLFTLGKFKEEQNLSFDLLSDFNKTASTAYHALHETFPAFGMHGVSKRSAFVIDKEGIIQYAEVLDVPSNMPNFEAINATLAGLN
ncbi:MAG: redoxin domain-containing protein [Bacteroidota bacterium]